MIISHSFHPNMYLVENISQRIVHKKQDEKTKNMWIFISRYLLMQCIYKYTLYIHGDMNHESILIYVTETYHVRKKASLTLHYGIIATTTKFNYHTNLWRLIYPYVRIESAYVSTMFPLIPTKWHMPFCKYFCSEQEWICTFIMRNLHIQNRKGCQDDCPGSHWRLWRQASTSRVTTRAIILTTLPLQCMLWWQMLSRYCDIWLHQHRETIKGIHLDNIGTIYVDDNSSDTSFIHHIEN